MKHIRLLLVTLVTLAVFPWLLVPTSAQQSTALERGYRTGYSDGYNAGFKDISDGQPRDYQGKDEYLRADRSYNQAWGSIEDYRDGYQQGFEVGYAAGYERQAFNSTIPTDLSRRPATGVAADDQASTQVSTPDPTVQTNSGSVFIARDTVLLVEMLTSLSTDASQRGDRFQARVVEPGEYNGAIVEGRVTRVRRPGKVKGVAELQLDFEVIRLPDQRVANLNADVIEVLETHSSDGVATVDPEGGVRGRDSTKDDVSKVGAATGIGAIIGAIAGGGKGAAIGAVIGGGIGTGGVLNQRGKDIRLERGQQLRIRTATETRLEARN
ncbi:MAG TPA: hypothetical protein VJ023_21000 [Pyrinomonadaceae bacterium]|nr:hypothetical protein [Pyrinomonadaceae bacterium]